MQSFKVFVYQCLGQHFSKLRNATNETRCFLYSLRVFVLKVVSKESFECFHVDTALSQMKKAVVGAFAVAFG